MPPIGVMDSKAFACFAPLRDAWPTIFAYSGFFECKMYPTFVSLHYARMDTQESLNYNRIAAAIDYIKTNFKQQPNLDEVAEKIHLSPAHFQRLFTEWAGTSPKKFLQYISIGHAKEMLRDKQATLFDAAFDTGLSST